MSLVLRPPTPADAVRWWQTAVDPEQRQLGAPAFVAAPRSPEDVAVGLSVEPPAPIQPQSYVVVDDDAPEHLLGDVGWRGCSSTTASRTRRRVAPRARPAS